MITKTYHYCSQFLISAIILVLSKHQNSRKTIEVLWSIVDNTVGTSCYDETNWLEGIMIRPLFQSVVVN